MDQLNEILIRRLTLKQHAQRTHKKKMRTIMVKFSKDIIKPWTYGDLCKLKKLAWKKTPAHLMAQKLDKTVPQVRDKASRLRCSLLN